MKYFSLLLFALVPVLGALAQTELPEGKARIIVWGDVRAFDFTMVEAILDDNPPFQYKASERVVIFDVDPGRHYLTYIYHSIVGEKPAIVGVHLAAGQTAHLIYTVGGSLFSFTLVPEQRYLSAPKRPVILNPYQGGTL